MRFTYPQYNNYESMYRIPEKSPMVYQHKNFGMRMTMSTASTMTPRIHRKGFRTPSKRHPGKVLPGKLHSMSRIGPGKIVPGKRINPRPHPPPCDNSNDSGFGFDQHVEIQNTPQLTRNIQIARPESIDDQISDDNQDDDNKSLIKSKRKKLQNIQIESDDACSDDIFNEKISTSGITTSIIQPIINSLPATQIKFGSNVSRNNIRSCLKRPPYSAQNNISTTSKDGTVQLQIVLQPEQQHRARYQTEGSRGAVKDRSGNGFPVVKLIGYNKSAILEVFIGTDVGRVAPHMFYQACKVAGKNSTPCNEKKQDGTMIIEIDFKPETDMTVTCDCVGILKERNVDVEHRFPDHSGQRNKKKSTRCRMVFRTQLTHDDGTIETLQVCSQPIICTQPPGVPEVCRKSLKSCPADGGLEFYILGKNFLKDTCIVFQSCMENSQNQGEIGQLQTIWEETVYPDKEYLQQTHLVFFVPPYMNQNIIKPVTVQFFVMSSGKKSEIHNFLYTPKGYHTILSSSTTLGTLQSTLTNQEDIRFIENTSNPQCQLMLWNSNVQHDTKHEVDSDMMPPPTTTMPLGVRRGSISGSIINDTTIQSIGLKSEIDDDNTSNNNISDTVQNERLDQETITTNSIEHINFPQIQKPEYNSINIQTLPILNNANFTTHENQNSLTVVDIQVKTDQLAEQILSATQNQDNVNKFLSSLETNMSPLKQQQVDTQNVNTLFVNDQTNDTRLLFQHNINSITSNTTNVIENNFQQNCITNSTTTTQSLNEILNLTQNDSPVSVHSPSSNSLSSPSSSSTSSSSSASSASLTTNGLHSPITQDIILNSEPAASINSVNIQLINSNNNNTSSEQIPSEMILNPTITPSMMCPSSNNTNNLITNQVPIGNSILGDISIAQQAQEQNLLNNMIMNTTSDDINKTTSVNVNNMILKAAADFITNQEPNLNTENTINALISLDSNRLLNERTTVSQMLNITSTNVDNVTPKHTQIDICQGQQHISTHFNDTNCIPNHSINERRDLNTENNLPLRNLLLNHEVPQQLCTNITSSAAPESLMSAVSLAKNELKTTKISNGVGEITLGQSSNMGQTGVAQTTATTIPQELTTMSDQDLIRYINPSCFDQV